MAEVAASCGVSGTHDAMPAVSQTAGETTRIIVEGRVQGVGFRPFVYRLATRLGIDGHVRNCVGEVEIVAHAEARVLQEFRRALIDEAPLLSRPRIQAVTDSDAAPAAGFCIRDSRADAEASIFVPPDNFMCEDCREEIGNPDDRRYRYPFTNCTQCGPRYTLIEAMPYDRPNTSMRDFPLCADCEREYGDPLDRRFHAEPVACPVCGPRLCIEHGDVRIDGSVAALERTADALRHGGIIAVKGIGGYHLLCDATNDEAVRRLRERKQRPDKPFAVMFAQRGENGLAEVLKQVELDAAEAEGLRSPARPIVLARKRNDGTLSAAIAPGLAELGVFLPYSPLHALLLDAVGRPLVATSGNISGEPVLTDNEAARRRLDRIVDAFLHHDRPIVRPADDPVQRRIAGRLRPLRLGRGTAPCELRVDRPFSRPTLAVGAHMKGTVALGWGHRAVVSPHIGEMDSPRSLEVFEQVASDLQSLYGIRAERLVCDAHSGYTTHRWAREQGLPVDTVWHHEAHASAVAAEARWDDPSLVFTWDGVGLGRDGSLWGGEGLLGQPGQWRRVTSLKAFRLPGGERAGREPWRSAAALLWEAGRDYPATEDSLGLAHAAWRKELNAPVTTAAGRLFDAAAALVTGRTQVSFEAQGPMLLESLCRAASEAIDCPLEPDAEGVWRSDWTVLLDMLTDARVDARTRAERFHASMAGILLAQARRVRESSGVHRVGLGGGVFQNRVLTEQAIRLLEGDGFDVFLPERLPCNDAAISFGQLVEIAASDRLRRAA